MSEKIKEFIEVPQQFVRDGNQVRALSLPRVEAHPLLQFITRCTKPSSKGSYSEAHATLYSLLSLSLRVRSDMQSSRYWLRSHGFHRLLRQTHPYSYVGRISVVLIQRSYFLSEITF